MIRRRAFAALFAAALLCVLPAFAQFANAGSDAGFDAGSIDPPDGSVGEGGADRDNPEGDDTVGRVPTTCQESVDCAAGFRCENRRCRYVGIRDAEGGLFGQGCTAVGDALLPGLFGITLAVWLRTRRRCRQKSR